MSSDAVIRARLAGLEQIGEERAEFERDVAGPFPLVVQPDTTPVPVVQFKQGVYPVQSPAEDRHNLPWSQWTWQQCKAVREPREGGKGHHGRCDLVRNHPPEMDHALERGMDIPRWSTTWTS